MLVFQQGEATAAYRRIYFRLLSTSDGVTPVTGATVAVALLKNGAAATPGGTVTEVSGGLYYYEGVAGDLDTLGSVVFTFSAAGAFTFSYEGLVRADPVYSASATAPTNFSALSITSDGAVTAGTVSDKTDYALGSSQTFSTTGSVGSVTGAVATVTALGAQAKTDVTDAVPTAAQIATAHLDLASAVDGLTPRQVLGVMLSVLAAKVSGMDTNAPAFRDYSDTLDRVTATTDANGNRTVVTVDLTGL